MGSYFKDMWKSITVKINRLFRPRPIGWLAVVISIFLVSLSMFVILNSDLATSQFIIDDDANSVDLEFFDESELNKIDSLTRISNGSLSYLGLAAPLYSKLNTSDIFSNTSREDIFNLISNNPGITLGAITRKLKIRTGTATHHLRILEREDYIKSTKTGKFRRYYKVGTKTSGYNELQDDILLVVKDRPGISQSEIARELNHSRQLINYHLNDLVTTNIVKLERTGNKSNCFFND
jgi:DNA-binding MarR family transcriptional regulator